MPRSVLVRVVFGVLVLATFGAFLVAQRLKRSTPIVDQVFYKRYIAPRCGHCKNKRAAIHFALREAGRVTATIVDDAGDDVRTLVGDRRLSRGPHTYVWDGRTDAGVIAPDGVYRLRVSLRNEGRSVTIRRKLTLDTVQPHPRVVAITPPTFLPGAPGAIGRARIRYRGRSFARPLVRIYRTDVPRPQLVATFEGQRGRKTTKWDGATSDGRPAPDGVYVATITTFDRAGNAGSGPPVLPPTRDEAKRGEGVSVRYLTVRAPLAPVAAGALAHFQIGPVQRRLRWSLGPPGIGLPLARGQADTRNLAVRVPSDARTGLYLLRVRAGGHRAVQPVAVQSSHHGRVLVVLPAISWQGANPVDDDGDGFPNTLGAGDAIRFERAFAGGRPPAGLVDRVDPLMRFLARQRGPYDLTTDLALARSGGANLGGHSGVLFAGDETWLTGKLGSALRSYVQGGGRVASFGTDSFRRRVSLGPSALRDPTPPERVNVFGEQTAAARIQEAPLAVNRDGLNLFGGSDQFVGLFTQLEQSQRLVAGTQILSSAGRDPQHPAFVAYRLGKGVVVRTGSPQWNAKLAGNVELTDVTRRIWSLLSR